MKINNVLVVSLPNVDGYAKKLPLSKFVAGLMLFF